MNPQLAMGPMRPINFPDIVDFCTVKPRPSDILRLCIVQLGKPSISYEPLSEVEQQDVEHNIRLYISGAIPELEVRVLSLSIMRTLCLSLDWFSKKFFNFIQIQF